MPIVSGPSVRKFLDLSTAHLPEDLLDDITSLESVVAYRTEAGAFVWVADQPELPENDPGDDMPSALLAILVYARQLGCDYVLFDRDGPRNPHLPTWEWK